MKHLINHFMWGYQSHFRIQQECACERIFQLLDEHFDPQVFLVGVLIQKEKNRYTACVDPEQDFWANSSDFNKVLELADGIRKGYKEQQLIQSHPQAQKLHNKALWKRSVRDAIHQIIEQIPAKPPEFTYFVSPPTNVEGYLVSVVLGLQKAIIDEYPSLISGSVPIHEYRSISVAKSLIDAVVQVYLDKISGELQLPVPGSGPVKINAEEILRDAAGQLMMGLAYRADSNCIEGWYNFLSSCTNIARAYYEKAEGTGTIVLARESHPSLEKVVQFQVSPKLHVTRASRKLLQLASYKLALHTNSNALFGLVKVRQYEAREEDLFIVKFLGHHHWQVLHNSRILMAVRDGQPYLPKPPFDEDKLRRDLPRLFKNMKKRHIDRILSLIRQAKKETHGTILIITSAAKKESERLSKESIAISPKILTPKLLRNLTPIDGAVLLNTKGTCYAVGVILDGTASEAGNPARGARYNSAVRYVLSSKFSTLAVIVSEDGGVDFFPNLRPMIKHSEIIEVIDHLREIAEDKTINHRRYNEIMEWLDQRRFYLLPEHCNEINKLKESIDNRLENEAPSSVKIIINPFSPNKNFNKGLYYENEHKEK